jgi:prolyl oligopeptidase
MINYWLAAMLLAVPLLAATLPSPPKTKAEPVTETIHGVSITDPYRWLEDQNSPETRAWIDQQMNYTRSALDSLPGRDRIHKRLEELEKVDIVNAPSEHGGRYFFTKRLATQDQFVLYMRTGAEGKDEVLVDPNPLSPDHSTSVALMGISRDGRLLGYGLRKGGEDETPVSLLDTVTRKTLRDQLPRARYFGFAIKPDRSGVYYSKFTPAGWRVHYHAMGSDAAKDPEIFGSGHGPGDFVSCDLSRDGKYLLLEVRYGWNKSELFVKNLATNGPIVPIAKDLDGIFDPSVEGDRMFLRTNWNAPNWHLLLVDLNQPERTNWKEIIPERQAVLDGVYLTGGKLALNYLDAAVSHIEIHEPDGKLLREIELPSIGSAAGPYGRWDSDESFYVFTSFTQPPIIYRYAISTGKQEVWFQNQSKFDSASIEVKQDWYISKDRTHIPIFLVSKKGIVHDLYRPALLTGYGGFSSPSTPRYSALAAFWVENGGVYAVPSLRGGSEFGETWHKAGMLENKQNVFDDFIAAAEYLVKSGFTRYSRMAIMGGSNGGLLVGAAMTQRPDMFGAVVCTFPLLDMIRYQKFKVAKWWVPEYGSSDDPKQFEYLYKYSPYHHVKQGEKYPAVLFMTGDSDTRVDPLHARKMAALMQASTGAPDHPILLHYDTEAGHSGGLPVTKQIDDQTDILSFLSWQLGK